MADRSPDSQQLAKLLEQLALKVVMLEEDDVQGLGGFLAQLEELQAQVSEVQELAPLLQHMNEVGQRLVLHEMATVAQGMELLNNGISLLQKWTRDPKWPPASEAWENYLQLTRELGLEEGEKGSAPPVETPAAQVWDDPELVGNFLTEAQEHLEGIETHLVFLEQHPEDLEAINAIFRPFHTLKGVAGFLNLAQIQELSHEVEWLLDRVRDSQVLISAELINLVLEAVDLLKAMLVDLQEALTAGRSLAVFDLAPMKAKIAQVDATSSASAPRLGEILVAQEDLSPEDLNQTLEIQKATTPSPPLSQVKIHASDLNTQVLTQAQRGIYPTSRVEPLPPEWRRRFFQKGVRERQGFVRLKPEVRQLVNFFRFNLMDPLPFREEMDIIFCRNVMIYFERETQVNLVNKFYQCLRPGGYLFIGHSESLCNHRHQFSYVKPTIYRK